MISGGSPENILHPTRKLCEPSACCSLGYRSSADRDRALGKGGIPFTEGYSPLARYLSPAIGYFQVSLLEAQSNYLTKEKQLGTQRFSLGSQTSN